MTQNAPKSTANYKDAVPSGVFPFICFLHGDNRLDGIIGIADAQDSQPAEAQLSLMRAVFCRSFPAFRLGRAVHAELPLSDSRPASETSVFSFCRL